MLQEPRSTTPEDLANSSKTWPARWQTLAELSQLPMNVSSPPAVRWTAPLGNWLAFIIKAIKNGSEQTNERRTVYPYSAWLAIPPLWSPHWFVAPFHGNAGPRALQELSDLAGGTCLEIWVEMLWTALSPKIEDGTSRNPRWNVGNVWQGSQVSAKDGNWSIIILARFASPFL
jgi:hypothetical protein